MTSTNEKRLRHALAIALAAILPLMAVSPADAQRPTTRDAPRTTETTKTKATSRTSTSTPLQDAATLKRAGRSAGQAAVTLSRRHRMRSDAVASTLIRVGYAPGPVGRALVDDMKVAAERAAADLERAGVRESRALYGAVLQMSATRADALKVMRAHKGSRWVIGVLRDGTADEDPPTAEEAAQDMAEAGFTLDEIFEVLSGDPYAMDVLGFLHLLLAESWAENVEAMQWAREKGVDAREALQAAVDAGMSAADAAVLLAAAGWAWEEIVDALEWTGESALDATRIAVDAGAPLADMVRWLIDTGKATTELIFDAYHEQIRLVLEIMVESHETQEKVFEASSAAHDAGMSLPDIGEVLMDHGLSFDDIAEFLNDEGLSFEEIAEFLNDQGLSSEQIAQVLANLGANVAQLTAILTSVLDLSYDAAMAIIGNI